MKIKSIAKKTLPLLFTLALTSGCSSGNAYFAERESNPFNYEKELFLEKGHVSKSDNGLKVFVAKYRDKNFYPEQKNRSNKIPPINKVCLGWEVILEKCRGVQSLSDKFQRLTNNTVQEYNPVIDSKGSYVVFERYDHKTNISDLYKIDLKTNIETRVTDKQSCKNPTISPNGKKIAFNYKGNIWVMDKDGSNEEELLNLNVKTRIHKWNEQGLIFAYGNLNFPNAIIDFEKKEIRDFRLE